MGGGGVRSINDARAHPHTTRWARQRRVCKVDYHRNTNLAVARERLSNLFSSLGPASVASFVIVIVFVFHRRRFAVAGAKTRRSTNPAALQYAAA